MQLGFGTGVFWGTPLTDANGNNINNPTPIQLGVLQDLSLDISWDTKTLYGQNQFPVAAGRGKGKMSGKTKAAQLNGLAINALVFGGTTTSGLTSDYYDVQGSAIPATSPYTVTVSPPGGGVWSEDLGVRNSQSIPMTRVSSAPSTNQYSVSNGVYTFASADTGKQVMISYQYTVSGASAGTAVKSTVPNILMGQAPTFKANIYVPYGGKSLIITIPNCLCSKFSLATKQDDFLIPELDFEGFADTAGNAIYWSTSE